MKNYFIIMADVIRSRNHDGRAVLLELQALTAGVNEKFGGKVLSPLTITLGDEFQGVVSDMEAAVRILLLLEEQIILRKSGFKLKYVVWFGEIETMINHKLAHGMIGKGLTEAREKLNGMKGLPQRFFIRSGDAGADEKLLPALRVYQFFVDQWSGKDHPLVAAFLDLKDYKLVSRKLGRDVSLMWRRQRSLHMDEYHDMEKLLILLAKF